jgi:hypothetical protein
METHQKRLLCAAREIGCLAPHRAERPGQWRILLSQEHRAAEDELQGLPKIRRTRELGRAVKACSIEGEIGKDTVI